MLTAAAFKVLLLVWNFILLFCFVLHVITIKWKCPGFKAYKPVESSQSVNRVLFINEGQIIIRFPMTSTFRGVFVKCIAFVCVYAGVWMIHCSCRSLVMILLQVTPPPSSWLVWHGSGKLGLAARVSWCQVVAEWRWENPSPSLNKPHIRILSFWRSGLPFMLNHFLLCLLREVSLCCLVCLVSLQVSFLLQTSFVCCFGFGPPRSLSSLLFLLM